MNYIKIVYRLSEEQSRMNLMHPLLPCKPLSVIYHIFEDDQKIYIISDDTSWQSLPIPLPEKDISTYFGSIVMGLHMMHKKGILHGNLNRDGILIHYQLEQIKIVDFSQSKFLDTY